MAAGDITPAFGELGTDPWGSKVSNAKSSTQNSLAPAPTVKGSSGAVSPISSPEVWTTLKAAGEPSPGVIPVGGVSGFKRITKWDAKTGKGTDGATTTRVGAEPANGTVKILLWKDEHFAAWDAWLGLWAFDAKKKTSEAKDVIHPALQSVKPPVVSCVMTGHTPIQGDDTGLFWVEIDLLEYLPAKPTAASTAKGSAKGYQGGKNAGQDVDPAVAKLQAQIKALAAQAQGTA